MLVGRAGRASVKVQRLDIVGSSSAAQQHKTSMAEDFAHHFAKWVLYYKIFAIFPLIIDIVLSAVYMATRSKELH